MLKFNSKDRVVTNATLAKQIARQEKNEVLKQLHTTINGLNPVQAKQRLEQDGLNEVSNKEHHPKLHFLIDAFMTPFTGVLLFLAGLSFLTNYVFVPADQKDLSTVIIMIMMVLISGITSFIQNVKTSDAVDSLLNMVSVTTNVKRAGEDKELPTKDVVVGDIINLAAGDLVPADMYLLKSKDLFCSASSLNGESSPVEKMADQKPKGSDNYLDYPNILYEGTNIVSGSGMGVVFATGDKTVFGNLARTLAQNKNKETTFDIGIKNVSKILLIMTAVIAPLVFLINGLTKGDWLNALIFAIATAVGLTPEMLPVIVTSNLVKGSVEMAKHETIVKRMNSIQNFGSADILCTDKTGTLTQDKVVLERHYNLNLEEKPKVLELSYLNSYYQTGMKDLIDKAVIDAAQGELDTKKINQNYRKIDEIPFDFKRRRMSVVVINQQHEHILVTKGAAEEMLACSNRVEIDGAISPLDEDQRQKILTEIDEMNQDGLRVVLLGYKKNPAPVGEFSIDDENELILVGFLAFLDPPKDSAKAALTALKEDGITVKILTGDNEAVTRNVGKQVGLNIDRVYQGKDLENKTDAELKQMVQACDVFVKLSPQQKAQIIDLLRQDGHTVAYMGDGINDAPAMKAADVAISVDTAVDIAKKSADIILLHKDLMILEKGVQIGRQVFGNTMKYIKITLSSNFGNILSILVASSFLPFLPMLPIQLLILDLMYGTSCLSIPFDTMNKHYLSEPRKWSTKKLPKFMFYFGPTSSIFDIITFALLFFMVCPQVTGTIYAAASTTQKLIFSAIFCTGWFIESLWTQEMVIHALRDPKLPFIKQHATAIVTWATIGMAVVGTVLPFITPIVKAIKFGPIPMYFLAIVFLLLILYIALTTLVKKWYLKSEKYLI
ncbi:magnesium-translocating P-type ATPase [Lactobacillus gasseri]|uniref:Magnesium-transporting ATPase, P-type 1 n=1 Tax=Lactobacillus gasseri TaxID=1596 RepID=A0AB33CCE7_LACGS|nr:MULTISPECIES: magnesium-translocating P-type ATPase [Lactobacillus]ART99053.1 magnesium-translocating P-type ATPase [Lactobacillus gasseri]KDA99536.1 magnesium ABC transporter ATPase [Lactobacillus paragasseri K7]MCT7758499.1 magnesium-translocating P-type ATPase [Lactobacillus gasseri]MCZ3495251.1 magnesium-translocating P-type ATPase [Lactobacillus gasseri]MCZ3538697.1 magnesium-translocating P-type ATPase [Lactobacillus gasseri]